MYLTNTINFNSKMLINLQPALLFHRHSDIKGTDKDEILRKLWEQQQEPYKMNPLHL